jgi:hypothetical protein
MIMWCGRAAAWLPLIAMLCAPPAAGQTAGFVGIGAGAGVPVGSGQGGMNNGWITEIMAGTVLPNNIMSVRAGVMYAQNRIDTMDDMQYVPGGTDRLFVLMGGLMAMPDWDWDWVPYVHAGAGAVHARFHGGRTSFAWSAGAGTTLKWRTLDFFVEGRLLQARGGGDRGEMASVTTGVRVPL